MYDIGTGIIRNGRRSRPLSRLRDGSLGRRQFLRIPPHSSATTFLLIVHNDKLQLPRRPFLHFRRVFHLFPSVPYDGGRRRRSQPPPHPSQPPSYTSTISV